MNIQKLKHIHFTGIKGVGMTALALCAQDLRIKITGSDVPEIFVTDKVLKERKIPWKFGFDESHINKEVDLLIATGAHGGLQNTEVLAAKKMGISVLTQAEALAEFGQGKETIAVCGVGGKTTTSALIAHILDFCGLHPSYAIGVGRIYPLGYPGRYDKKGKWFVCEADEYVNSPGVDNTPKFLFLTPKVVVATNIEHDHPDIYPTLVDTKKAYSVFFRKIPKDGILVVNAYDKNVDELIRSLSCRVVRFNTKNKVRSQLPGEYNQKNIAAAMAVADYLEIPKEKVLDAVSNFGGTQRRFEKIGKTKNFVEIYDDYAHHPKEIEAVLKATRERFPKRRIIAVFQPHTYTRTKALFKEFAKAFDDCDIVAFMDIYSSARETKDQSVSSKLLAQETKKNQMDAFYSGDHKKTVFWLKKVMQKGDIVLTLGAGDIFYMHKDLLKN